MVNTHETDDLTWLNGRYKKNCPLLEKFLPTFGTSLALPVSREALGFTAVRFSYDELIN